MIVHIFNGRQIHLAYTLSKGYISTYSKAAEACIVIYGGNQENKKKYLELFEANNFNKYFFISSLYQFSKFVKTHRKEAILFHGGKYEWYIIAQICGNENVNWVCWGDGSAIGNNWKSRLMTPVKRYIYNRFRSIIVLMDEDRTTIVNDFHVNSNVIKTIPYQSGYGNNYELFDKLLEEKQQISDKPLVLLGNSPREMRNYIKMLNRLSHLKGKIRIHCMNNYSLKRTELYYELIETGKRIYGDDFQSNENFHSERIDYINYMNTCDVYICSSLSQTGLGAIGTCLRLGKKIYIHGKNLNWIRSHYGAIVFDTDDISSETTLEELAKPLDIKERKHNRDSYFNDVAIRVKLWENYLREIDGVKSLDR